MKNVFKKLFVGVATFATSLVIGYSAQLSQLYNTASTNNLIGTNGIAINSITIANAGTNQLTIKFFDSPNINLGVTNTTGYTNFTMTTISVTNIYTNYNLALETNVYTAITNTANVLAGFTNSYPVLLTLVVPTNTTTTYIPATYMYAFQGLTTTNNTCGASSTVTINYSPFK